LIGNGCALLKFEIKLPFKPALFHFRPRVFDLGAGNATVVRTDARVDDLVDGLVDRLVLARVLVIANDPDRRGIYKYLQNKYLKKKIKKNI
jgi:hypothetical protein